MTKTPLQKTLDDQKSLFNFLGSELPDKFVAMQKKAFDLVDTLIDAPEDEKEVIKTGIVIALSPPFILDDVSRFDDYGPAYSRMIAEMLNPDTDTPSKMLARITVCSSMVMSLDSDDIKAGTLDELQHFLYLIQSGERRDGVAKILAAAEAPALARQSQKQDKQIETLLIAEIACKTPAAPAGKKPDRPPAP